MKKIVIASPDRTNPNFKKWAKEAAVELLEIFPEYKNSFTIEFRDDAHASHKKISQQEYDLLPNDENKRLFIKDTDGNWLVPHESMAWYIAQAKKNSTDNSVNLRTMSHLQQQVMPSDELVFNLVNEPFKPYCYGYGVQGKLLIISTENPSCQDENFFKTILMHEFGHILRATHIQRANTHHDPQLGVHCTNDDCIMGESDYHRLSQERMNRKAAGKPPFCNECIEAMRDYLSHMPELTREVQVQQFSHQLPYLPHNDDSWKESFRTFYTDVANRDGDTYSEDKRSPNYLARIKRADGTSLEIEANNEYNIALGAKDINGNDEVPALKDMRDLVKLAQSKNSGMDFGKDNDPEFNARLMIACMEAKPKPLNMRNQPELNDAFFNKLLPGTRRHLKNLTAPNAMAQFRVAAGRDI